MTNRHPSVEAILRFFESDHLPEPLKDIALTTKDYLGWILQTLPEDDPELTVGLRKLLEAKDCFIRAAVAQENRKKNNPVEGEPV